MNVMKSLVGVWVLGVLACAGSSEITPLKVLSLEIASPGSRFAAGATVQLEAEGLYANGSHERVTDLVRWESSDATIATIDAEGLVTLVKPGSVELTASLDERSSAFALEVTASPMLSLSLSPATFFEIAKGLPMQFHVEATFADGTHRDVCAEATWSTAGARAAPMDAKGQYRFDTEGQVIVTAQFAGVTAERVVQVRPAAVRELRIAPFPGPLKPGQRVPVQVTARYTDESTRDVSMLARVSSLDPTFAEVTDGLVTAVSAGTARIIAEYAGQSASRALSVNARELVSLVTSLPSVDVASGRSIALRAFAGFDDGSTLDVSEVALWESTDRSVAEVVNGVVWARAQGSAEVRVSYGGEYLIVSVFTHPPLLEQLSVTLPQNVRLVTGQTATFAISGRFSDGANLDLSQVATVRASPLVSVTQSASGVSVTGLASGPASIELEVSGVVRRLSVEVSDATISRLRMRQVFTESGEALSQLRVDADYSDGVSQDVTELCAWSSSDAAQIFVDDTAGARGAFRGSGAATVSAQLMGQWVSFTFVMP